MRAITRKRRGKADPRGNRRPYIGCRKDGKQQRFNVGEPGGEADTREDRIRCLYRESAAVRQSYQLDPSWTEAALHAAKLLQTGVTQVVVPPPDVVNEAAGDDIDIGEFKCSWTGRNPYGLIWSHAIVSRQYPSVNWVLPDGLPSQEAIAFGQMAFDVRARQQAAMLGADVPENPVAGTLHEALDAYQQHLERDVARLVTASTLGHRLAQTKYIKNENADTPLAFVGLAACREMISHWTGRPEKPNSDGEVYSRHSCKHRVSELSMFFDWLHTTENFSWRKPDDFDTIPKAIARDRDRRSIRELAKKETFSIDALSKINRECGNLERLLLLLGLNCSFGAAESGRLIPDDCFIREKNPLEHMWANYGFSSDDKDSWIAYLRPKSGVAGCWWLWPETVEALEQWQNVRPASDTDRIIVTERGAALYRDQSRNAQSGYRSLWTRLLDRVRANHAEVPQLPFGSLRDHFSDWCVQMGDSEVASLGIAHGTPFKDDLLVCYANLPFPRLFESLKKYREWLAPMFDDD